ncbi:MAG: hypothetical protein M3O82_02645 [Verrucomicrobiota bacterium]|nr:hypothetical protein [Verrucomicrobiota bacterium]
MQKTSQTIVKLLLAGVAICFVGAMTASANDRCCVEKRVSRNGYIYEYDATGTLIRRPYKKVGTTLLNTSSPVRVVTSSEMTRTGEPSVLGALRKVEPALH